MFNYIVYKLSSDTSINKFDKKYYFFQRNTIFLIIYITEKSQILD